MPVTASRALARDLSLGRLRGADAVLLAAEAQADQRAWAAARRLLVDRTWPDVRSEGRARLILGRAYLALDSAARAAEAFTRYLAGAPEPAPARVRVELARALAATGRPGEAAAQLGLAARDHPSIGRWLRLSRLQRLAAAQDTAAFALADSLSSDSLVPSDSLWLETARLAFRLGAPERGLALVARGGPGVRRALAEEYVAPHLTRTGDEAGALELYRMAIERGSARPETGPALLEKERTWRTLATVAASDLRSGRTARAIGYLEEALAAAPPPERRGIAEMLGGAHRAGGHNDRAIQVLSPWLDPDAPVEDRASLWLLAARTFAALGQTAAADEAYARAARGSGSDAALAAYLLADTHHDESRLAEARSAYERSYERFPETSYGSRSLERLALLDIHQGRYDVARDRLAEYRRRYPSGDWAGGALYWSGRAHEAQGDTAAARAAWERTISENPLDYYAILAGRRLGTDRWAALDLSIEAAHPALAARHAEALGRMNLLRELGWTSRARREFRGARGEGPADWPRVLAFAHALNAAGWTQEGVSEGWRAKSKVVGWSRPLLRAIHPLPFAAALSDAARDRGLSPHLVAGLARRESMFDPEIVSVANAIGLMQLLPQTARDIASRAGLPEYERSQLTVPQVNLLLGTRYLADLLQRFGGRPAAALISYNAGPHRYLRWREFPEFADDETLVERIPFRETREYVRAVTELTEIYRFLYPELAGVTP